VRLDPRTHAVRNDIADIGLADRVFAPHYARPETLSCIAADAILREAPSADARAVSQILHGEDFAVVDVTGDWAWGYCLHDDYVGHVPLAALGPAAVADHVVHARAALMFAEPDIKAPAIGVLPMGARLATRSEAGFLAITGGFVHPRHARPLADRESDSVAVAERLTGAPYLWGGRGGGGVDCSGLVQLALGLCGVALPRDTDQQRSVGHDVDGALRRGDLVFFPGHVGLMVDGDHLLHANAHWMAVVTEPLADVIARLRPNHDEPVLARRRILP